MGEMLPTRNFCVASATYPRFQKAGETTFVSGFGIRMIEDAKNLEEVKRRQAIFRTGIGMVSRCVQPMRSRRALPREMPGKTTQSPADILSRSVDLKYCGYHLNY